MDISSTLCALQEAVVDGKISEVESVFSKASSSTATLLATTPLDDENTTLLHISAIHGSSIVVESLLRRGADMDGQNDDGFTGLHVAAMWGQTEVVRTLLEHGANPLIRDSDGCLPVDHAKKQGHTECVHLLEGHTLQDCAPLDHTPLDDLEMSIAETYVSMYNCSHDNEDLTCVSDYTYTPSPPNRLNKSHDHRDHASFSPSPRQKLIYSPPSKSAESENSRYHGDDSLLYTTAVEESCVLDESVDMVGRARGGADEIISKESPLNRTYVVNGSSSGCHGNSRKCSSDELEKQVDELREDVSLLSTSTHQTRQTGCACYTPSPLECSFVADINVRIPEKLRDLSDGELREKLVDLGERPGPITPSTKVAYLAYLAKLEAGVQPAGNKGYKDYKYELSLVLNGTVPLPDLTQLEKQVFQSFRTPCSHSYTVTPSPITTHMSQNSPSTTPTTKLTTPFSPFKTPPPKGSPRAAKDRGTKDHFNYVLLDPRVLEGHLYDNDGSENNSSELDKFRIFVESVFYVGKGKNSRSMQHLKDAKESYTSNRTKLSEKLGRILDIWSAGYGVVSLQLFHNTTASEAFTREACLIDAIGIDLLTNVQRGHVYGDVSGWSLSLRRRLGVHLLYKAFQSYKLHQPQQLYITDL